MSDHKGILFVVATPIGNLEDITLRAVSVLKSADLIYSEDTRESKKLLTKYAINTELRTYLGGYRAKVDEIISELLKGKKVAIISDRGTPCINDPGYEVVREAMKQNIKVVPVPGVNAAITALSVAGFSADKFYYAGFLPKKGKERAAEIEKILSEEAVVVFYESPARILKTLKEIAEAGGSERECFLARELTKLNEEFISGLVKEIIAKLEKKNVKGELVVVLGPSQKKNIGLEKAVEIAEVLLHSGVKPSEAAKLASEITGLSRSSVYKEVIKKIG